MSSLTDLKAQGWKLESTSHPRFHNARAGVRKMEPVSSEDAERILSEPPPPSHRSPRVVHVTSPDGQTHADLMCPDDVSALSFFYAGGDSAALQDPDLAQKLDNLADRGIPIEGEHPHWQPGPLGAYAELRDGGAARVRVGTYAPVTFRGRDVDAGIKPAMPLLDVLEHQLVPQTKDGTLDAKTLGQVLEALARPLPVAEKDEACAIFLEIAEAMQRGPEADLDAAARTTRAVELYGTLGGLGTTAEGCRALLPDFLWLVERLDSAAVKPPAQYLLGLAPSRSVLPESLEERTMVCKRAVELGTAPSQVGAVTETIVMRPASEALEPRLKLYEDLVAAAGVQTGYDGAPQDLETILQFRSPGVSVSEAGAPYVALLGSMACRNHARRAATTYVALQDFARVRGWSVEDATRAFLTAYSLREEPKAALEELKERAQPAEARDAGQVEKGEGTLRIGGVEVPVRP